MTVNPPRFNRFIAILGFLSPFLAISGAFSQHLSDQDKQWIAEKIYANECNSLASCLTSWNQGEEFPSLGIGHFIWYPSGYTGIYTESFPALLDFYNESGFNLPDWLFDSRHAGSPWSDRSQFYADFDKSRLTELRILLQQSMAIQADFIIQRQQTALPKLLSHSPEADRKPIEQLFYAIASASPPYGAYALVDYVNFKGEGIAYSERYQGQGWGLLQVLQEMLDDQESIPLLQRFNQAATAVLQRRVENAPVERNEQRWLKGWLNRTNTYVPPTESD